MPQIPPASTISPGAETTATPPETQPVQNTAHQWPHDPAWELERMWVEGSTPRIWIVYPLIAEGDQVILAGEPKSGKSLLVSQVCMEIAKGPGVLRISPPESPATLVKTDSQEPISRFEVRPKLHDVKEQPNWTVLYVSFEMGAEIMWARTMQQSLGLNLELLNPPPPRMAAPKGTLPAKSQPKTGYAPPPKSSYVIGTNKSNVPFFHVFELAGQRWLGLVPTSQKSELSFLSSEIDDIHEEWQKVMSAINPDLIIFDSLSQLHLGDENSNLDMRQVLRQLRQLCTVGAPGRKIAHIVIHHTRKESGDQRYVRKDASEMRGASSIHAEADLAITITKRKTDGSEISLSFSSRHCAKLPDVRLARNDLYAVYSGTMPPEPTVLTIARQIYDLMDKRGNLKVAEIMALHAKEKKKRGWKEPDLEASSWEKMLNKMKRSGALVQKRGKRGQPMEFRLRSKMTRVQWTLFALAALGKAPSVSRKVGKSA